MIKTAIITPIAFLTHYAMLSEGYHLVLASVAMHSAKYRNFYSNLSKKGHFVILDNDAHESGTGTSFEILNKLNTLMHPSEIVLPDKRFYGDDTYHMSQEAFEAFHKYSAFLPQFMAVAHGRTLDEWTECASRLIDLGVDTIGVTLDYEVWPGGLVHLVHILSDLMIKQKSTLQIHLLGWGRSLTSLRDVARMPILPRVVVRSTDSAKPLTYAASNIRLEIDAEPTQYPGRPANFFALTQIDSDIALHNIKVFQAYAHNQ
jgi:hypothetical protein